MARPDWAAVRLAFINGTESYAEIAERSGVTASAARKRGERESWMAERHRLSLAVTAQAQSKIERTRAHEIADWNSSDVKVAKALRAQVAKHLSNAQASQTLLDADLLRTLAAAQEAAQRIARAALGIAKDNPPEESQPFSAVRVVIERKSARKEAAVDA